MPIYLDTRGHEYLAIGLCDRCSRKFPLDRLYADPNFVGLRVCKDDIDEYDPWRLPAPAPENIALRIARPDVELTP
jgi:hypothetical protein